MYIIQVDVLKGRKNLAETTQSATSSKDAFNDISITAMGQQKLSFFQYIQILSEILLKEMPNVSENSSVHPRQQ